MTVVVHTYSRNESPSALPDKLQSSSAAFTLSPFGRELGRGPVSVMLRTLPNPSQMGGEANGQSRFGTGLITKVSPALFCDCSTVFNLSTIAISACARFGSLSRAYKTAN